MDGLLEEMTKQKEQHRRQLEEDRQLRIEQRKVLLKQEKLNRSEHVKHERGWNFSIRSERETCPPHWVEGVEFKEKPVEVKRTIAHPWLPTTLRGHDFGTPSSSTLTIEYLERLETELKFHQASCVKELESLTSTTEEALYHRARCTQALREYRELLKDVSERLKSTNLS